MHDYSVPIKIYIYTYRCFPLNPEFVNVFSGQSQKEPKDKKTFESLVHGLR